MISDYGLALLGGILIGLAATFMLWFNGRVTGIAGIIYGIFHFNRRDFWWRWAFLGGLVVAGYIFGGWKDNSFYNPFDFSLLHYAIAGLVVGYSTVLGSGCTSGHGVCGLSRFSKRSVVATISFMLAGFLTVYFMRVWGFI